MSRYSDLEILFVKRGDATYGLNFRFNGPGDEAEQRSEAAIQVDLAALNRYKNDTKGYATALGTAFFTGEVKAQFQSYRVAAATLGTTLRVRLSMDSTAEQLHGVRWETLYDPLPNLVDAPLFLGAQTIVSRFLSSAEDWHPIRLRAKSRLRALVAIANPGTLQGWNMAPVDVSGELGRITAAMNGISVTSLAPGGALPMAALSQGLREGYDILYLVAHGQLVDDQPFLFLDESEGGKPIAGSELVQAIRELKQRPTLVVLVSCQSAGQAGVGLAGIGPKLAEAGVPAVIAMQGDVFMATAAAFFQRFFTELLLDGQIDRAMSIARGEVRAGDDYWRPVLFLRLRNGRIWYEPGFGGDDAHQFSSWASLCNKTAQGDLVPILGPELGADLFGDTQQIAMRLARKHGFPLGEHESRDLAKVTQFLTVKEGRAQAIDALMLDMIDTLGGSVDLGQKPRDVLRALIAREASTSSEKPEDNPYWLLSAKQIAVPIYLNASYENLLFRVLKKAGKSPEPVVSSWLGGAEEQKPKPQNEKPTPDAPWTYHIFGLITLEDAANSLVLTEDDFFDFLIRTSSLQLLPKKLTGKLATSSLVFLGFRLDDWRFRVLFRLIASQQSTAAMNGVTHVGVQVTPGEQTLADVRQIQDYMERLFAGTKTRAPQISIYWGSAVDFLKQLKEKIAQMPVKVETAVLETVDDEY